MKEIEVRISQFLKKETGEKDQDRLGWFAFQLMLAYAIDQERLFQKVGGDFLKITMADIKPYNEQMSDVKGGEEYEAITALPEVYEVLKNRSDDFKTWFLKAINLGLMAPNMELYFLNEGEYRRLELFDEEQV